MNEANKNEAADAVAGQVQRVVMRGPRHMKQAVCRFQEYMATYHEQEGYENYSAETFIDDVLYGLGVAIEPRDHQFAQGFDRFKKKLTRHLGA